jgi:glycosyltransferase involved in cell wall biosynthesis
MTIKRMRCMPKVSICIPTYNRKAYLQETLSSVFAQTYEDYEVVVLDDGSTDGTPDMMQSGTYDVRYYWQENQGEAAARNRLIRLARGRYVSFIDSDDLLVPDAIERLVKAVEAEQEDVIAYGSYIRIDQDGNHVRCSGKKLYSGYITNHMFQDIFVHPAGSIYPRRVFEDIGEYDTSLRVCTDYDLELRASTKYRFIALDEPTFLRRRHADNISRYSFDNCKAQLDVLDKFYHSVGRDFVSRRCAVKSLGKQGYRAGRCALREGSPIEARELLKQSFCRYPSFKTLLWLAIALTRRETPPARENACRT